MRIAEHLLVQYVESGPDDRQLVFVDEHEGVEQPIPLSGWTAVIDKVSNARIDAAHSINVGEVTIPESAFDQLLAAVGYFVGTAGVAKA